MALSLASSSTAAHTNPEQTLQEAIQDFQTILSNDQRQELGRTRGVPDADTVLIFTAELDSRNRTRKGRSIASNLYSVLQSVRDFSAIVDTFVSSHPDIAALVWGSVRLTMLVVVNFVSYYEAVAKLFIDLGDLCPRFAEYQALYPNSMALQTALCNFQASIVRCCKHLVQAIRRPWQQQLVHALWESFDQEFRPDRDDIQRCSTVVKKALALAKAQADHRDQQLQDIERKQASTSRRKVTRFIAKTSDKLDRIEAWQLERDERRARERRQQLLDALTTHDYLTPLKQSRRKRHGDTTQWLFQTKEFDRWISGISPPLLWCSGKIGSGKTILTTSVVDHVLTQKRDPDVFVAFFFPRFDDQQSLKAETVIRSIVRQALDPGNLSDRVEAQLREVDHLSGLDQLLELLRSRIAELRTLYIVIDGLDEFENPERDDILKVLSDLVRHKSKVRVFLASRESLSVEIRTIFPSIEHISMSCPSARPDIESYVDGLIQSKLGKDLNVSDQSLVKDIKQALIKGADGMFLWVMFQIDEICSQHCDDDIRKAINNLPRGLTELFHQVLHRIVSRGNAKIAQKAFPWVAAAKRPLRLDELREALFIRVSQPYSRPERHCNDIDRITSWCENLLQIDEEQKTVQFPHHTVLQILLQAPSEHKLKDFHVQLNEADHYVGEICITYLNFNDFKTTLARRQQPIPPISPAAIAQTALGNRSKSSASRHITRILGLKAPELTSVDITESLASFARGDQATTLEKLQRWHPFVSYASTYWTFHTSQFHEGRSKTWSLWREIVLHGHGLAEKPWGGKAFDATDPTILDWSYVHRHYALVRLIDEHGGLSAIKRGQLLEKSAKEGDIGMVNTFLDCEISQSDINLANRAAAGGGHLEVVERLLAAGADVNSTTYGGGQTALQMAAGGGYLEMVERLLAAGADVNAAAAVFRGGLTALQAAVKGGHFEVVERLLAVGADVNAAAYGGGQTALQAAVEGGYEEIVSRLREAGA